jgi:hypothetical protein
MEITKMTQHEQGFSSAVSVETGLKMGIKNWRRKTQDREQWRTILKEAKVHQGL